MVMNRGNRIPQKNKNDILGQDVWTGSKIIVLSKSEKAETQKLTVGNYTLLI